MGIRDYTIYDAIRFNAGAAGSAPAAITPEGIVTHMQFLDMVDRLAAGLRSGEVTRGERVCILAQNSVEYLAFYGACAKVGAIAWPLNWRMSPEEIRQAFSMAGPKLLVVGAAHLPQLSAADTSLIPWRVLVGSGEAQGFTPLADFYQEPGDDFYAPASEDPFVVISTAAVAGVPRGAVLTHANLAAAGLMLNSLLGLTSADRFLAALPLFHISGLGMALGMIQIGGTNVILEKFDPGMAARMIDEHSVSLIGDFPPILSLLLDARGEASWGALRYVFGLDSPDVITRLYQETGAKFWTGFGQSETTGVGTFGRADLKPGSAGRPLPLVRLRLVDNAGHDVPPGEAGEIVMQGPVIFSGYWQDPDATQYTFRDGWHHTGDLGKFDPDGYLYYAGRKPEKDLIKSGGENIYPAEVEHAIASIEGVEDVCVIGVPDEQWGEAVKAVVQLAPEADLTAAQVIDAVAERIASFKKPRLVLFVPSLPRTASGEVDRQAVKAAYTTSAQDAG